MASSLSELRISFVISGKAAWMLLMLICSSRRISLKALLDHRIPPAVSQMTEGMFMSRMSRC